MSGWLIAGLASGAGIGVWLGMFIRAVDENDADKPARQPMAVPCYAAGGHYYRARCGVWVCVSCGDVVDKTTDVEGVA